MNPVTDDDLVLLYYGEHDDPELAEQVARSPELSARFERLVGVLERIDQMPVPRPEADYGARLWHQIAPRLERPRFTLSALLAPKFSLAGAAALVAVALLAFWLGRQSQPVAAFDRERLLTSQVSTHLERAELLLTEYVNSPGDGEAAWAAELLAANRVYRVAAERAGHVRLGRLLEEMEPLLLELANDGATERPDEFDEGLLFRVRVMHKQLLRNPNQA